MGSDGFEKVLIGTRGARETLLQGRKGRAAKNSVLIIDQFLTYAKMDRIIARDNSSINSCINFYVIV